MNSVLVGNGPRKVMVLHGWLGGSASWAPLLPYLDRESHTYAFMDFRGYGERVGESGDFTMAEAAEDTMAEIRRLGWDEYSLVAHSMSGLVAQMVVLESGRNVRGLFGISPVPACGSPLGEREHIFREAVRDTAARESLLSFSTGDGHGDDLCRVMASESVRDTSPAALDSYLTSWTSEDVSDRLTGMIVPVTVAVGDQDAAYPPDRMNETWGRYYPNYELCIIPESGHYPMNENPSDLGALLEEFISSRTMADTRNE